MFYNMKNKILNYFKIIVINFYFINTTFTSENYQRITLESLLLQNTDYIKTSEELNIMAKDWFEFSIHKKKLIFHFKKILT